MSDHALPTLTQTYTNFLNQMMARVDDAVKQNRSDTVTLTNPPVGAIRWNTASALWETNTGTVGTPVWTALAASYAINAASATKWASGRTISLNTDASGTSAVFDGTGNTSIAMTLAVVNSNVGSFGTATAVPNFTVNAKGLVTAAGSTALYTGAVSWTGNTVAVGYGGTGAATLTGLLKGNGTAAFTAAAAGTDYVAPGGALGTPSSGSLVNCSLPASALVASLRSSNTILGTADKGTLIDITSGTFAQTFAAAATLGSGWWCYIRNRGTGVITLDPNAAETIGGLTTVAMAIGDVYLLQCNGTSFTAVLLDKQNFSWGRAFVSVSTGATFTTPENVYAIRAYLFGAGGAGAAGNFAASGGGGGSCSYGTIPTTPGTVFTFTVSGSVVTLNVGGTTYLTSNSGAAGAAVGSGLGTAAGGAGGAAGSIGGGLNIFNSGAYAGGGGGSATSSTANYHAQGGGGGAGSPLGAGGTAGAASAIAVSPAGATGGGAFLYGTPPSTGGAIGGAGVGGSSAALGGGGAGGPAVAGNGGPGRSVANLFTDPLLVQCVAEGSYNFISIPAGPGAGGASSSAGGAKGGFGGGGGGGANAGSSGGEGGFGGGGGSGGGTSGTGGGGAGGIAGGGGGGYAYGGADGAACVVIMY